MKIMAYPRDPNPYQELLYTEMRKLGVDVSYLGELTPSQTCNLLLLPLEMTVRRIAGARIVHLHWVFAFSFPCGGRFTAMRWMAHAWFLVWLWSCGMLGVRIVWTAHNVLPHEPVFANDVSARRSLVAASHLVLVHSESTLSELSRIGAVVRKGVVIQHGPVGPVTPESPTRFDGTDARLRKFLFFARIEQYKGIEELLSAFAGLSSDMAVHLTIAGQCDDLGLRSRICEYARRDEARLSVILKYVSDEELSSLLDATDVVVLPFRKVTTSSSAMLALSRGRPLIVPDLPGLSILPEQAVLRYAGGVEGLADALTQLTLIDRDALATMSAAARRYVAKLSWPEIAEKTISEMLTILKEPHYGERSRRRRSKHPKVTDCGH